MFERMIIAEIGSVHDGSIGNALKLIDLAQAVGAQAVKFQTHLADFEVTELSPRPRHFLEENRHSYFQRTGFSQDEWRRLKEHAEEAGLVFMSSVFSQAAVELLSGIGVNFHKVPSGELTNLPLIRRIAQENCPTILSTGMSNWAEIDLAVENFRAVNSKIEIAVLQCTSLYPCPPELVGLNLLPKIQERYGVTVGLSDHSFGPTAAVIAAYLGATIVEKHLTFSRHMYGSDAPYAMEPREFSDMVQGIHEAWALSDNAVEKNDLAAVKDARRVFLPVAVAARDISPGEAFSEFDFEFKKSGPGLSSIDLLDFRGKTIGVGLKRGEVLREEHIKAGGVCC